MKLTFSIFAAATVYNLTQAVDLEKYAYEPTENVETAMKADAENSFGIEETILICEENT